jgi:S1-C subfamily serine protease
MPSRLILLLLFVLSLGIPTAPALDLPAFFAPEEVARIRALAEGGDAGAQAYLGTMSAEGRGVLVNEAEALKWFRKAADQGHLGSQYYLGIIFLNGAGTDVNLPEAVKWLRLAAGRGHVKAQYMLSLACGAGQGTPKDPDEAFKWALKAAQQGHVRAQTNTAFYYRQGSGVRIDPEKAFFWFRKAADQGDALGQLNVGLTYSIGRDVKKDPVEAYKWYLLAGDQGDKEARKMLALSDAILTPAQRTDARRRADAFVAHPTPPPPPEKPPIELSKTPRPKSSGSGFFITENGYLITNEHVAAMGATVRVRIGKLEVPARVVKTDHANDLALLKAEGKFAPLAVIPSRDVKLGATVATVGFPNVVLQGLSPKLAKGEIASLAGINDNPREFQMSVPVQPGNSGGPLVDDRGNVVGVVVSKLDQEAALAATGALAENVNYAIKSSRLLTFLESVPDLAPLLKPAATQDRKFEEIVQQTQDSAALILIY